MKDYSRFDKLNILPPLHQEKTSPKLKRCLSIYM